MRSISSMMGLEYLGSIHCTVRVSCLYLITLSTDVCRRFSDRRLARSSNTGYIELANLGSNGKLSISRRFKWLPSEAISKNQRNRVLFKQQNTATACSR